MTRRLLLPLGLLLAACTPNVPTAPAEPTQITLVSAPATGTPGWVLDDALTVKVTDASGRPVVGAAVSWQAESDGAAVETQTPASSEPRDWRLNERFVSAASSVTDAQGIARVRYLTGWANGTQRVVARAGSATLVLSVPSASISLKSVAIAGKRACGIDETGRLFCWQPTWTPRTAVPARLPASMRPIPANTTERFVMVTGAGYSEDSGFCGLTTDHALRCFRDADFSAAGSVTPRSEVVPVPFYWISGSGDGMASLCGLGATGVAWCRGDNSRGQLGDGGNISRATFAPVSGNHLFSVLVQAYGRACGVDLGGAAWCWGEGPSVSLGIVNPSESNTLAPRGVAPGRVFRDVAPVASGACGIEQATNQLYCWGFVVANLVGIPSGSFGQDPATARQVIGSPTVLSMSGDAKASAQFVTTDGRIANWGDQVAPGYDLQLVGDPEFGAGLTGFDGILTRGSSAACASHNSGSTICSWSFYRGVGVPAPN